MRTNLCPIRGVLLLGLLAIYYIWLFVGTAKSGEYSLNQERTATDTLSQPDFLSSGLYESGAHDYKLHIHPFDEPRAREIKSRLHAKTSESNGRGPVRGTLLLHSWQDNELFRTALESDRRAQHQLDATGDTNAQVKGKIAFMFLGERDPPLEPLWAKFLRGNGDRYNIYVHLNPFQVSGLRGVFWGRGIPSIVVERNTPGFIAAARRLLANAILSDPRNEWFALLSDACIPLHSFNHIYETLESTNKSLVEINNKKFPLMWYRYVARGVHSLEPEVSWADFKMGSKWWIMRKKHARMIVGDRTYWNKFNLPCHPEHKRCYPEEHYFSTVLSLLDKNGSTGKAVTFQNDKVGLTLDRPKTFHCSQINSTFFSILQSKDKGQWLFAQRFSAICLDKLLATTRSIYHQKQRDLTERIH